MEWKGMNPNRFMPWYFCAKSEAKSVCYGVKVRPSAMCFWQSGFFRYDFIFRCSLWW